MRPPRTRPQSQEAYRVSGSQTTTIHQANFNYIHSADRPWSNLDRAQANVGSRRRRGHYGRALEEAIQSQKSQWPRAWGRISPISGGRTFTTMTPYEKVR